MLFGVALTVFAVGVGLRRLQNWDCAKFRRPWSSNRRERFLRIAQ